MSYERTTHEESNNDDESSSNETKSKKENVEKMSVGFPCPGCKNIYNFEESLIRHRKRFCGMEPRFFCEICNYKTTQKHHLTRHLQQGHRHLTKQRSVKTPAKNTLEIFTCPYCEKLYVGNKSLKKHMQDKHNIKLSRQIERLKTGNENKHICGICEKKFKLKKYLKDHLKRACCKPKEENVEDEEEEEEEETEDEEMESNKPTIEEKNNSKLNLQEKNGSDQTIEEKNSVEHTTSDQEYVCTACNKMCESRSRLLRHINRTCIKRKSSNSQSKKIGNLLECEFCDFSTFLQSTLAKHTILKHPESVQSENLSAFVVE